MQCYLRIIVSATYNVYLQVGIANLVSYEVQKLANTIEVLVAKHAAVRVMIKQRGIVTQSMKPLLKVRVLMFSMHAHLYLRMPQH